MRSPRLGSTSLLAAALLVAAALAARSGMTNPPPTPPTGVVGSGAMGPGPSAQPVPAVTLANVTLMRTHSLLSPFPAALGTTQTQYHTIQFVTGTAGVIAEVEIDYQGGGARPTIDHSRLIEVSGLGAGAYSFVFGTRARYTVTTPVSVPAGTEIKIMLGDIYATTPGCYSLFLVTRDPAGVAIENGSTPPNSSCNNKIGKDHLAGVIFGTCEIDPPRIRDNRELHLHMNGAAPPGTFTDNEDESKNSSKRCSLAISGSGRVIAFPPADFDSRLIPKGSSVDCSTSPCHLDVTIRNGGQPDGGQDGEARVWSWIAFEP